MPGATRFASTWKNRKSKILSTEPATNRKADTERINRKSGDDFAAGSGCDDFIPSCHEIKGVTPFSSDQIQQTTQPLGQEPQRPPMPPSTDKVSDQVDQIMNELTPAEIFKTYFDTIGHKYNNFNIVEDIEIILQCRKGEINHSSAKSFSENEKVAGGCPLSVKEMANDLQTFFVSNRVKYSTRTELLGLIRRMFPDATLPLRITDGGNLVSMVEETSEQSIQDHILTYHCCPNGDHVFAGHDFHEQLFCPNEKCQQQARYSICKHCSNSNALVCYEQQKHICLHNTKSRVPLRVVQYRPVITIVKMFLESKQAHLFFNYFDHQQQNGKYHDIHSGSAAKKHMNEMNVQYHKHVEWLKLHHVTIIPKPCNLLISVGYDGMDFFKHRTAKTDSLVIRFLNLPPSLRTSDGIGVHTIGFFAEVLTKEQMRVRGPEREVESFLLRKCFVDELEWLNKGVTIETKANGKVFVQVRLISHTYDTIALQAMLKVQCNQSSEGCPFCDVVEGAMKPQCGSVVFIGHRCLTPLEHSTRYKGNSGCLLPLRFHTSTYRHETKDEQPFWAVSTEAKRLLPKDISRLKVYGADESDDSGDVIETTTIYSPTVHHDSNGDLTQAGLAFVKSMLRNMNRGTLKGNFWYSTDICNFEDFQDYSYAHHMDYRLKVYKRRSNQTYVRNALLYAITNKNKVTKTAVNGANGITDFVLLPYFDFNEQAMFDPFHTFMNQAMELLNLLRGEEGRDDATIKYCEFYGFHPSLHSNKHNKLSDADQNKTCANKTSTNKAKQHDAADHNKTNTNKTVRPRPVYTLRKKDYIRLETWVDAMVIPRGYGNKYAVHNIISSAGNLTGVQKIFVISALMELLITALLSDENCDYPNCYISYLRMHSDIMTKLLAPQFSDKDIEEIFNRTVEFLSVHELLLPHTSAKIVYHQMLDLPKYITVMGPMRNFWSLYVERALSQVRQGGVKKGGEILSNNF
jgi:hypothetical protein